MNIPALIGRRTPSEHLINAVIARIQSRKDLWDALLFLWSDAKDQKVECEKKLGVILAQALIDTDVKKVTILEKRQGEDSAKKTDKRWRGRVLKGSRRSTQLRKFSEVAQRVITAQHNVSSMLEKPARHNREPYRRLAIQLFDYFAYLTPQPHKFIAAITGLFNLHPRKFCAGCKHFPIPRKIHQRVNQSLTERVRRGTHMCKLRTIFDCSKRYQNLAIFFSVEDSR